jgi:hypothetical protein
VPSSPATWTRCRRDPRRAPSLPAPPAQSKSSSKKLFLRRLCEPWL